MKLAIPKIERRIADLENFDVASVQERYDPRISSLSSSLDTLLTSIFGAGTAEYQRYRWSVTRLDTASMNMMHETPLYEVHEGLKHGIATSKAHLEQIKQWFLEEITDSSPEEIASTREMQMSNDKVFVVHGHNDGLKQSVARLLEKLSVQLIILHEQPNAGKTIVEKFEEYADVGFAVVLLTPDDVGGPMEGEMNPRARQNVILELGYFIGKLGRSRVCTIYMDGVELPSDLSGVLYVKFDEGGLWQFQLAKEMKAAAFSVDLNSIG